MITGKLTVFATQALSQTQKDVSEPPDGNRTRNLLVSGETL